MKFNRRIISMNFMQVFRFPAFYLSILGVCLICCFSIKDEYSLSKSMSSAYHFFDLLIGFTMYKKLIVLIAAIPFTASFCSDWNCQYIKPIVIRSGIFQYSFAKVFTCFLSSFLVVFIGLSLFIMLLVTQIPLYPNSAEPFATPPFAELAQGSFPILYIAAEGFVFSLAASFWSVVGLAVSAYIPNRFVAISTPLIASYILEELTSFFPDWLNLYYLTRSSDVLHQGAVVSFCYFFLIFVVLSFFVGIIFYRQVRRRMRNEVV